MYWIEKKYINLVSPRVESFKWKSGQLANGRCPICHDSSTNSKKARFYFIQREGHWQVYCHNCNYSATFKSFLKRIDSQLFSQMLIDELTDSGKPPKQDDEDFDKFKTVTTFTIDEQLSGLKKLKTIHQLDNNHPAKIYIKKRLIPDYWHSVFRWSPNFNQWINDYIIPGKFDKDALKHEEGRIVIPFFDKNNYFHALTGRTISPDKKHRYLHIVNDVKIPPIWGQDRINLNEDIYVFEGVFDAIFIPNALAICGGNFNFLKQVVSADKAVVCFDFEPRSKETRKKILKAIDEGFRVLVPPYELPAKDLNDLILKGYSQSSIESLVKQNVYSGLTARAKVSEWTKV